jgi:hypothetical protein
MMEFQKLEDIRTGRWLVTSETTEGAYYIVTCCDTIWKCTCPAYVKRGAECKHVRLIQNDE